MCYISKGRFSSLTCKKLLSLEAIKLDVFVILYETNDPEPKDLRLFEQPTSYLIFQGFKQYIQDLSLSFFILKVK